MVRHKERDKIDQALVQVKEGNCTSLRDAASTLNVPRSTLTYRAAGRQSIAAAHLNQLRLTPQEGLALVEHIRIQTLAGFPLAIQTVRQMANVVLCRRISPRDTFAIPETVGKNWPTKFYQRHPELAKVKLQVMDQLQANAVKYEQLLE